MFFRYLEHLRQKPVHVRNQYAFWFATLFVGVLGVLWLLALPQQFLGMQSVTEDAGTTPFVGLFNSLRPSSSESETAAPDTQVSAATSTATTTAEGGVATTTSLPSIVLTEETLQAIASSTRATSTATSTPPAPPSRPVLIATTSAAAAADPE